MNFNTYNQKPANSTFTPQQHGGGTTQQQVGQNMNNLAHPQIGANQEDQQNWNSLYEQTQMPDYQQINQNNSLPYGQGNNHQLMQAGTLTYKQAETLSAQQYDPNPYYQEARNYQTSGTLGKGESNQNAYLREGGTNLNQAFYGEANSYRAEANSYRPADANTKIVNPTVNYTAMQPEGYHQSGTLGPSQLNLGVNQYSEAPNHHQASQPLYPENGFNQFLQAMQNEGSPYEKTDNTNQQPQNFSVPNDKKNGENAPSGHQPRGHLSLKDDSQKAAFKKKITKPDAIGSMPKYLDTKSSEEEVFRLKKALSNNDTICALFSVTGIIIAFIEEDLFFQNGNKSNTACFILRSIVSATSALLCVFIYRHYNFELKILKARRIVYQSTSLFNSGLFWKFLFEFLFSLIHPPPGIDWVITNYQLSNRFDISLDAYITFVMLFRLYISFRLFDHYTFWTGQRSARICKMNGFQANPKFAIKAYLKYKPFTVLGLGLLVSVFVFGLGVRLFEKPFNGLGSSKYKFDSPWNSFWCIIVTMATIGYGDIYPSTHFGRLVTISACVWGNFLLSLFVVALSNNTEFTKEESEAFEDLNKSQLVNDKLSKDAYLLLQTFLRLKLLQKHKANLKDRFLMRMDMISLASRYRSKRKGVLSQSKSVSDILQEMQEDEEYGVEELINFLAPVKEITSAVENIQLAQVDINSKVLEVHEMSKKLFSLLSDGIGINNGEVGKISSLKELNVEYDTNGEKVTQKRKQTTTNIDSNTRLPDSNLDIDMSPSNFGTRMRKSSNGQGELRF